MKKYLVMALLAAAFGFMGCGEEASDEKSANLKWDNQSGGQVADIKWVNDGDEDQSWDGDVAEGEDTKSKEITELKGKGECLDADGEAAEILITKSGSEGYENVSDSSAEIKEDADAVLVIGGTAKK